MMADHDIPAFPQSDLSAYGMGPLEKGNGGMTLRDWFAGQALTGLMSDPGLRPSTLAEFSHMAERLYQVADALLAAREKPND